MIQVRQARLEDVHAMREIFRACYGMDYSPRFYDESYLTKLLQCEESLVLVAKNTEIGQVVGTAAVDFEGEADSDLVGQFGRLAVHPAFRRSGVGTLLMGERIRRLRDRIQVGLVETRVAQTRSLRIAENHGFAAVGFLPLKLRLHEPESFVLQARHFGKTLAPRKTCPRVILEVHPLALLALRNYGLAADAVRDEDALAHAPVYRRRTSFGAKRLSAKERAAVFEIERACTRRRFSVSSGPTDRHRRAWLARRRQCESPRAVCRASTPTVGKRFIWRLAKEGELVGQLGSVSTCTTRQLVF